MSVADQDAGSLANPSDLRSRSDKSIDVGPDVRDRLMYNSLPRDKPVMVGNAARRSSASLSDHVCCSRHGVALALLAHACPTTRMTTAHLVHQQQPRVLRAQSALPQKVDSPVIQSARETGSAPG